MDEFYKPRIVDQRLDLISRVFNAVNIVGPKGCGKTTTAKRRAKTVLEFQDEEKRENLLTAATYSPSTLLQNPKPILFDEWQDAPKIWEAIRKNCDDNPGDVGSYYLTGSSSARVKTPHTGTMRITTMKMEPMSLFEMGRSNGQVRLSQLFDDSDSFTGCQSSLTLNDVIEAICIGGWPRCLRFDSVSLQREISKDLFQQTCERDISQIDGRKRNANWAKAILKSYARNICTTADRKTLFDDVSSNCAISYPTFSDYVSALENLYVIQDIDAWCPSIRAKTNIRSGHKRNFIDPSIAAAALGISPEYLQRDFRTLGFLFQSLCIKDLRVYSYAHGGNVSYYRDRLGLEVDAVLHLEDGRYALIEFKLGEPGVPEASKHLCQIERLVAKHNASGKGLALRMPDLKIVIIATGYGCRLDNGVFVVPIGCLRD